MRLPKTLVLLGLPLTLVVACADAGDDSHDVAAAASTEPAAPPAARADERHAPPDFATGDTTAIYVEIESETAELTIDAAAKTASVKAHMEIDIHQPAGGSPVLDVVPVTAKSVIVDGGDAVTLETVSSPDGKSTMRMVSAKLAMGKHTIDFPEYALAVGRSSYNKTYIEGIDFTSSFEFLTDDDDLEPRFFWERYFPVGFECDRYPLTMTVNVRNTSSPQSPDVMANGAVTKSADGSRFDIVYPANNSTSSWFLHVIDRNVFKIATGEHTSVDGRTIPISAHAPNQAQADQAIADAKLYFTELEADYGPYPHDRFLISIGSRNDPEEYAAAVQTDMDLSESKPDDRGALGHEMLHQWFGRSARPLAGRDGWIDESIAEWRDDGYARASSIKLNNEYAPLAFESPYQRQTPDESYDQGSSINRGLDLLLKDRGGLKPVLKAFHAKFRDRLYTTEDYLGFLREAAPDLVEQMNPIFEKKVYAGAKMPDK